MVALGHDVLAVDEQADIVQKYASDFTHVVAADTTDTEALRQIGAEQFEVAVVGIGTDIEASVLTVLGLLDLGVKEVWAKAISGKHAAILERVGATHVIRPESQMGKRVAHMVTGTMTDFIEFDEDFAIARTRAPKRAEDKTLKDCGPAGRVRCHDRGGQGARPRLLVRAGRHLRLAGRRADRFRADHQGREPSARCS